ncbi:MAG: hypothetical protein J6A04_03075 [Clostridia bacterium]|nr:hypothetical protein [Clostridia bacterium]
MSSLKAEFNKIIAKIEERITDQEELNFIKQQIADISMLYMNELDKVMDISERRVNQVVENQRILEKKQLEIETALNNMEKELFVGEEDYDFEIVCPYCNYEFVSDIGSDIKEVECPECHNIIELDWNAEEEKGCAGHCGSCGGCGHEEELDDENDEENNDDDM